MKNNYQTIDDAICDFLDQSNKRTKKERGYKYWSASSLGKCKRHQTLSKAGVISHGSVNYAWRNAAQDGHAGHEWRQAALESVGSMVSQELPIIDEDLRFRGHYDLVVNLNGKLILGDIKTQNNRAFKARQRLPGGVDECHKRQLGSYYYFLKRDVYPDLAGAHMYYVNKNTGERDELKIYFEKGFLDSIINELKTLNSYWDKGILPKKEPSYFCHICQHNALCKTLLNKKDTKRKDAVQRSLQQTT